MHATTALLTMFVACKRMRKLGDGQSVVFCVPEEIKTRILKSRKASGQESAISVSDVLAWSITETWADTRRTMPLWAVQGLRFDRQSALWSEARKDGQAQLSRDIANRFLENEAQSLERRYRPAHGSHEDMFSAQPWTETVGLIKLRCQQLGHLDLKSADLHEEQERELCPETEQERAVEKPAPAEPAKHQPIHPDLVKFISEGKLVEPSEAYMPAFMSLQTTSAAAHFDVSQFPSTLLVTAEFARTVKAVGASCVLDAYQRPVQWILTNIGSQTSAKDIVNRMIIISPYEAQELLPLIQQSRMATLHIYSPRQNLAFHPTDGLDLHTVPHRTKGWILERSLVLQLNLFAGQLYFRSFEEYTETCAFLGLAWKAAGEDMIVDADGFILDGPGKGGANGSFRSSPIKFLNILMTKIRKHCESVSKTHMGAILDGKLLQPSDFTEG